MIRLRACASSPPCNSPVYAKRDVALSRAPFSFGPSLPFPSVLPGHLIRQSRTHSRNGDGRGRGERSQSIRTLSPSLYIAVVMRKQPRSGEGAANAAEGRARSPDNGERRERRERCCFHSLLCLWDWDGTWPAEANAAPPRDRSLGITDEECSERTYIIGHIYADRVRTVVLACLRDGARIVCAAARILNQSK